MLKELAIIGTTASSKSALAHELAKEKEAIILSLDSLSIYKEIDIASAKVSQKELEELEYFGINLKNPNEDFCVGDFFREYEKAKKRAEERQIPLIITGGSSFYLQALIQGLSPKIPKSQHSLSKDELWTLAKEIDQEFTEKFSKNDDFRLQKWMDIYSFCGFAPSKFLRENTSPALIKNLEIYEIFWEKEELIKRINFRVEQMFESALEEEASKLFAKYPRTLKALNCIGLKEFLPYFDGKISLEESKELIKIHTRQLAKKQRTFNKKFINKKVGTLEELRKILRQKF